VLIAAQHLPVLLPALCEELLQLLLPLLPGGYFFIHLLLESPFLGPACVRRLLLLCARHFLQKLLLLLLCVLLQGPRHPSFP
jgi:hypothetical protein